MSRCFCDHVLKLQLIRWWIFARRIFSTSSCLIDERRISFAILHTYIYLHIYVRSFFPSFFFLPRPAAVRRTVVICRVRACENTTEEYFTFRSVHARPDDSVAVPRHEAFISKYVYRCVQGSGSSLNKCRSIYKGSKMRMFLLSPFYPIHIPLLSFFLSLPPSSRSLGAAKNTRGKTLRRKTSIRYDVREEWKEFFSRVHVPSFFPFFYFLLPFLVRCVCKHSRGLARVSL